MASDSFQQGSNNSVKGSFLTCCPACLAAVQRARRNTPIGPPVLAAVLLANALFRCYQCAAVVYRRWALAAGNQYQLT